MRTALWALGIGMLVSTMLTSYTLVRVERSQRPPSRGFVLGEGQSSRHAVADTVAADAAQLVDLPRQEARSLER